MFQHTAARRRLDTYNDPKVYLALVSTHSRPKAAGDFVHLNIGSGVVSTHSRPKAAGVSPVSQSISSTVSTHSRPKAAGTMLATQQGSPYCFNTQPPEGGWEII